MQVHRSIFAFWCFYNVCKYRRGSTTIPRGSIRVSMAGANLNFRQSSNYIFKTSIFDFIFWGFQFLICFLCSCGGEDWERKCEGKLEGDWGPNEFIERNPEHLSDGKMFWCRACNRYLADWGSIEAHISALNHVKWVQEARSPTKEAWEEDAVAVHGALKTF